MTTISQAILARYKPRKAVKRQLKARIGLMGPAGSGKTRTSLEFAKVLANGKGIVMIDTENRSGELYADKFEFDTVQLDSFDPALYAALITDLGKQYDVVIVDSLSHAWNGVDGALDQVDKASAKAFNNKYAGWRDVTPKHNDMISAITACEAHVICTMRSKTEYILEQNDKGKSVPRKVGMAPVQRDGMEYEFTLVGEMGYDHAINVTKSRCDDLDGYYEVEPGRKMAEILAAWLDSGAPGIQRVTLSPSAQAVVKFFTDLQNGSVHPRLSDPADLVEDVVKVIGDGSEFFPDSMVRPTSNDIALAAMVVLATLVSSDATDSVSDNLDEIRTDVAESLAITLNDDLGRRGDMLREAVKEIAGVYLVKSVK